MSKRNVIAISTSPFPYRCNITDGPGYRAWNLLQALSSKCNITILSLYESFHQKLTREYLVSENNFLIKCISHKPQRVARAIREEEPDILFFPWSSAPFLSHFNKKIPTIIDYVGVGLLEEYVTKGYIPVTLLQLKLRSFWFGDFLMTAGQRERYYLLGLLAASKKLCRSTYSQKDPLIHIVPITPPLTPPKLEQKVIDKKPNELVLLVAGAFLPWYDYKTFFNALEILRKKGKANFKVILMGGSPKDPKFEKTVKKMTESSKLSEKLIFTGLVPFKQRANYYLSADVAINIPLPTIEDELSVRTRIVDYLWAQLPIITSARDEYSQIAVNNGAGFTYRAGDPFSLAQTIETIMDEPERLQVAKKNAKNTLDTYFNLKNYIQPLELFVENPYIDPLRLSPKQIVFEISIWIRDILHTLKRP